MVGVWQHTTETGLKREGSVPLSWDKRSTSWQLTPGGREPSDKRMAEHCSPGFKCVTSFLVLSNITYMHTWTCMYMYSVLYIHKHFSNILICSPRFLPSVDLPGNFKSQTERVPDLTYWTLGWLIHLSEPQFLLLRTEFTKVPPPQGPYRRWMSSSREGSGSVLCTWPELKPWAMDSVTPRDWNRILPSGELRAGARRQVNYSRISPIPKESSNIFISFHEIENIF